MFPRVLGAQWLDLRLTVHSLECRASMTVANLPGGLIVHLLIVANQPSTKIIGNLSITRGASVISD